MINTAIPMKSRGVTSLMLVFAETVPTRRPTKSGVSVATNELKVPPICMSWLPLFPPLPSVLSIGLAAVFSIHTQKPQIKAPNK